MCPSAQPDMENARIIGMVSGSPDAPQTAYLARGVEIDISVASHLGELAATEVFRFAATCEQARCCHFDGANCALADRIVKQLPEVVDSLPQCHIRPTCRWFAEQGPAACRRCPQILTMVPRRDDALNRVAVPDTVRMPRLSQLSYNRFGNRRISHG
jgi:hypothetical protein